MEVPKITDVKAIDNMNILVSFDEGTVKKYDLKILYDKFPVFKSLEGNPLFKLVKVEVGGVAIAWNDDIDLSRYDIWFEGETME